MRCSNSAAHLSDLRALMYLSCPLRGPPQFGGGRMTGSREPKTLTPVYGYPTDSFVVRLYDGRMTVSHEQFEANGDGDILLELLPSPRVNFRMKVSEFTRLGDIPSWGGVTLSSPVRSCRAYMEKVDLDGSVLLRGSLEDTGLRGEEPLQRLVFHLLNFPTNIAEATGLQSEMRWSGASSRHSSRKPWTACPGRSARSSPTWQLSWTTSRRRNRRAEGCFWVCSTASPARRRASFSPARPTGFSFTSGTSRPSAPARRRCADRFGRRCCTRGGTTLASARTNCAGYNRHGRPT